MKKMKGSTVKCPGCGAEVPLERHLQKAANVAYHDCGKGGRRAVLLIPDQPATVLASEEGVENGSDHW